MLSADKTFATYDIKAIAVGSLDALTFSPAAGSYYGTQSVTITSSQPGVTIYYTIDGSTPTTTSTLYTSAITVSSSQTIKAFATKAKFTDSGVGESAYAINLVAADPVMTVTSYPTKTVQITSATAGASIYYTTDNTTPTTSSTLYTTPFSITADQTIKAITTKSGITNSAVTSYNLNFDQARDYAAPSVNYMRHFKTGDNLNGWRQRAAALAAISDSPAGSPNSQALKAFPGDGIYSDAGYGEGAELPDLTTDFTIEMWLYVDSFVAGDLGNLMDPAKTIKLQLFAGDIGYPLQALLNSDRSITTCVDCADAAASLQYSSSSASVIQLQTWQHIA